MSKRAAEGSDSAGSSKKVKQDDSASTVFQKDEEGNLYVDLSSMKRATVSVFRGKAYVNLREYYTDKASGAVKPGKKGITLDSTQWASLVANIPPLTKQLELAEGGGAAKTTKTKESTEAKSKHTKPAQKKERTVDSDAEDEVNIE